MAMCFEPSWWGATHKTITNLHRDLEGIFDFGRYDDWLLIWEELGFFGVSSLEKFNRLSETVVDWRRSRGSRIYCHRNNVAIGNEPLGGRLEDGEFKSETRIANFPYPSVNMENLIEKRPVAVLAERFHIKEIDPGFEKFIVTVINRLQVFSQGYIEISQIVAEKDMPLLIRFYIANLDGMEKAIQVLRGVFLSHAGECSTNGLSGKVRKGNQTLDTKH